VTEAEFGEPTPLGEAPLGETPFAVMADDFEEDDFSDDHELDEAGDDDDMDEAAKARLAAALAEVDARFGRPPAEQVAAFTEAHQTLQATLARIDTN